MSEQVVDVGADVAADVASVHSAGERIVANIEQVIEGKREEVRLGLAVLLAEGHLLIEDVPGVGKTKFAKALARSIDCRVRRLQFTPDLLPSDITGVSIFNREARDFEFKPGPVFANIVVGDEINRASPKTQAALLECMEERQVTVDGITYALEAPFMVLATQNPLDMEGTYPLPEAQRDRFTARISMGYPDRAAEIAMLSEHASSDPLEELSAVSDASEIRKLIDIIRSVHVAESMKAYAVDLAAATRRAPEVRLGASPRATLQLLRASKAWAALHGRAYVIPDDLQHLLPQVIAHRLLLSPEAGHARAARSSCSPPSPPASRSRRRRTDPRSAMAAGFTTRATCLLAAGGAAVLCGLILGEYDLVRGGLLAAAIPLVAVGDRPTLAGVGRQPARSRPGSGTGRRSGHGRPVGRQPGPAAHRRSHARGPAPALRSRAGPASSSPHWAAGNRGQPATDSPALPRGRYVLGPLRLRLDRAVRADRPLPLIPVDDDRGGLPRSWTSCRH